MDNISTITVVLQGDLTANNLEMMADRISKAIRGDGFPAQSSTDEYKTCDGIDVNGWVCIGRSK
jgi:hypothetical protein